MVQGVYYLSRDEDTYNGMKIPAKPTVVPSIWYVTYSQYAPTEFEA